MKFFKLKERLTPEEKAKRDVILQKVKDYRARGCRVPSPKLIKTEAQIEGIRRSAEVNTGVLDVEVQR